MKVDISDEQRELIWAMTVIAKRARVASVIDHREVSVRLGATSTGAIREIAFAHRVTL